MHRPSPSLAVSMTALVISLSGTAYAATGGTFLLGKSNRATTVTSLTNSKGTALSLAARSGSPVIKVNNSVRIPSLNASLLQGKAPSAFLGVNQTAKDSQRLGGTTAANLGDIETARVQVTQVGSTCNDVSGCVTIFYGAVSGLSPATSTETATDSISPAEALVAHDLSVAITQPPGLDHVVQVGVDVGDHGGATLTCLMSTATQSCLDAADDVPVPPSSRLAIVIVEQQANGSIALQPFDALVGFRLATA
jgi:hypothetical protein